MAITLGKITRFALLVGLLGLLSLGACTVEPADGGGAGGAGAVSGMTATGGMGGMMATGGTGGMGTGGMGTGGMGTGGMGTGGMMAMPVMCGTATCAAIMTAAGTTLMPCCDATSMMCGVITSAMGQCTVLGQAGVVDTSCPNGVSILTMSVPGCCRPDNKCGLQSTTLMGCVERTAYPVGFLDMAFLAGAPNLPAQDCGATTTDGGTDSGTDSGTDAGN